MQLSNLPITLFCEMRDLLISATGKKGFIEGTYIDRHGATWKLMVVIRWECGKVSTAHYPDECTKIEVNTEVLKYLRPLFVQGLIRDTTAQLADLNELLDSLEK